MKVLILGGSGFLGSYVVDEFIAAGCDVVSLDRYQERFRPLPGKAEYCQADFGNRGVLDDVLRSGVDVVVHLVSSTIPQSSNEDPIFDVQSNLVESIALLQMCVTHKVGKVIYASSGGTVYGVPQAAQISEEHPTQPLCSYGVVKLAIEQYLQLFYRLHGLKYHVLRLSNPYGARQDPRNKQGAASVFMHQILKGQDIKLWGDGSVVRDFIHAADFARACLSAANSNEIGVVNIGSGEGVSIKALLSAIEVALGLQAKVAWLPARNFDVSRVVLDCSMAKTQLAWQPKIELSQGLADMARWMRQLIAEGKL
jgi:UDP-glucose 4-epimerase